MNTARLTRAGLAVAITIVSSLGVITPAGAESATGSLAGHITANDGAPAAGLLFVSNLDGTVFRYVNPDSTGFYQVLDLPSGEYTAEFTTSWRGTYQAPKNPEVVAGAQTVFDIVLPPVGSLQGRFTSRDGAGIANVTASIWGGPSARTGPDGSWRIDRAFARDDHFVHFTHGQLGISQYAYGKLSGADADRFTVRGGETTVVDDVLLPVGSIAVKASDSVTGAPIMNFWAHAHTRFGQTSTGVLVLADIPVGTHDVTVEAPGYPEAGVVSVTVVEGDQAIAAVTLTPDA